MISDDLYAEVGDNGTEETSTRDETYDKEDDTADIKKEGLIERSMIAVKSYCMMRWFHHGMYAGFSQHNDNEGYCRHG